MENRKKKSLPKTERVKHMGLKESIELIMVGVTLGRLMHRIIGPKNKEGESRREPADTAQ